ncbi:MAG: MBL fold metallo-hydrolase [Desulfurococcales archaeon]|nr:MBL fold metallo-hydrolase [Desulfurococcales archaeon]MCE4605300.1 MBL fold metallo-hydrolase [Desulfurococcales archaeon]
MTLLEIGDSLLLKGSPSTLFYRGDDTVYIVDPGHGKKRVKQIRKEIKGLDASRLISIITHYHSDHHSAISQGLRELLDKVMAPRLDAPAIRDPLIRVSLTFGMPLPSGDPLLPFHAPPIDVDEGLDPGTLLGSLEIVDLAGHTPGQVGILTPGGVLYAADSIFGPRVLDTYGVPYHFNPCRALKTLEWLRDSLGDRFEILVPSHGPLVRGGEAEALVESNLERVRGAGEALLDILSEPRSVGEAAYLLASRYSVSPSPERLMLIETAVKGYISCMRGTFEASAGTRGVMWRTSKS